MCRPLLVAPLHGSIDDELWRDVPDSISQSIRRERSHEGYEERKLYPYLEYRWGVSLDEARTGHVELHARADDVVEVFRSLARPPRTRSP